MKISDLKGRLADILEVPRDPIKLGRELWKLENFSKGDSPEMLRSFSKALVLVCIWEEFAIALEKKDKSLNDDVTYSEIELLIFLIERHFSGYISGQKRREEVQEKKRMFLEAVEILQQDLLH